jgi:hypothetical protein
MAEIDEYGCKLKLFSTTFESGGDVSWVWRAMRSLITFAFFVLAAVVEVPTFAAEHTVEVYKQPGRFAGWPANHGIWSWGDEIVVGFESGHFHLRRPGEHEHSIDYKEPAQHLLARSLDGGETWHIEKPLSLLAPPGTKVAGVPTEAGGKPVVNCLGGFDFTSPDFMITFRMADIDVGPSRFYCSLNRGKSWEGPFRVPSFGQKGIAARTDYLVDGRVRSHSVPHCGKVEWTRRARDLYSDSGRREDLELRFLRHAGAGGPGIRDHAVLGAAALSSHHHVESRRPFACHVERCTFQRDAAPASACPRQTAGRSA